VLATLLAELLLVNCGRCRGLRLGAAWVADAKYDAGLKDRPAMADSWCAVAAKKAMMCF